TFPSGLKMFRHLSACRLAIAIRECFKYLDVLMVLRFHLGRAVAVQEFIGELLVRPTLANRYGQRQVAAELGDRKMQSEVEVLRGHGPIVLGSRRCFLAQSLHFGEYVG